MSSRELESLVGLLLMLGFLSLGWILLIKEIYQDSKLIIKIKRQNV